MSTAEKSDAPKVSTGNTAPAANGGTPENPVIANADRKIEPGSFLVQVDLLDSTAFKNPRRKITEAAIQKMRHSLKQFGQLQNLLVVQLESGKLGVIAGYTRAEAFTQNVYEPLVQRYNKEHALDAPDKTEQRLQVSNPVHRDMVAAKYPEDFAKEKAKPHNQVYVKIDPNVTTPAQARVRSFSENVDRTDMPLMDELMAIEDFIEVDGFKAAEVAKILKKSPSAVSQYRRAFKLPSALRERLVTPDAKEEISESDLVKLKEDAKTLVDELELRMNLDKNDPLAVSLSHVRELSQRVVFENKAEDFQYPLSRQQLVELVCALVGADPKSRKLIAKKPAENYTLWMANMKNAEAITAKRREKEAAGETTTEEGVEPTATETQAVSTAAAGETTGTVEGLAAQQDAGVSTGNKTDAGTTGAVAAEANADAVVKGTETMAAPAAKGEGTADVTTATAAALVGADPDSLDDDEEMPEEVSGATGRKTKASPLASVKVKEPNVILAAINQFKEMALAEETDEQDKSLSLTVSALASAQFGYEVLGLDDEAAKLREVNALFIEEFDAYVNELEAFAEKAGKKAKMKFELERPIPMLEADEDASETGDSDVDPDALAALEGLDDGDSDINAEDEASLEGLIGSDDEESE